MQPHSTQMQYHSACVLLSSVTPRRDRTRQHPRPLQRRCCAVLLLSSLLLLLLLLLGSASVPASESHAGWRVPACGRHTVFIETVLRGETYNKNNSGKQTIHMISQTTRCIVPTCPFEIRPSRRRRCVDRVRPTTSTGHPAAAACQRGDVGHDARTTRIDERSQQAVKDCCRCDLSPHRSASAAARVSVRAWRDCARTIPDAAS